MHNYALKMDNMQEVFYKYSKNVIFPFFYCIFEGTVVYLSRTKTEETDMPPDGGPTMNESRSYRAFGTPMTARRIRDPAYWPIRSYTLARQMSGRACRRICPSSCRLPGLS